MLKLKCEGKKEFSIWVGVYDHLVRIDYSAVSES